MIFSEWIKINELKVTKKTKIAPVTHSDIDRWLKSVDGLARDLQYLKKAKDKSQAKIDQIKKKYKLDIKPIEKDQKILDKVQNYKADKGLPDDKQKKSQPERDIRERKPKLKSKSAKKPADIEQDLE